MLDYRNCYDDCGSEGDISDISDCDDYYDSKKNHQHQGAPGIESCLTYWTIEVLDSTEELAEGDLWFRIYFHREEEYVYYQGAEIIDYVRDLVELNGRSVFHVRRKSDASLVILMAGAVMSKLSDIIDDVATQQHPHVEAVGARTE